MDFADARVRLDAILDEVVNLKKVSDACSLSFGVLHGGQTILTKCLGQRNIENGLAANEDTMYFLASCSKMFLTAIVGIAVNDKLMDWNAPLSTYLTDFNPCHDPAIGSTATIRDFLRHSSGISCGTTLLWGPYGDLLGKEEDFVDLVNSLPTSNEDGQRLNRYWSYSNLGYGLVALAIQQVYDRRYHEVVRDLILQPLQLSRTTVECTKASQDSNIALPYTVTSTGSHCRMRSDKWTRQDHTPAMASMGVRSSVSDMLVWCKEVLLAEREQLESDTDKAGRTSGRLPGVSYTRRGHWTCPSSERDFFDQGTVYGLAWWKTQCPTTMLGWTSCNQMTRRLGSEDVLDFILGEISPSISVIAHNGVLHGSTSAVYTFPETDSAIVAFSTGASNVDVSDLCAQVLTQALFDLKPKKNLISLALREAQLQVVEFDKWQQSIHEWQDSHSGTDTEKSLEQYTGTYSGHISLHIHRDSQDTSNLHVQFGSKQNTSLPLNYRVSNTFSYLPLTQDLYLRLSLKEWHRVEMFTLQFEVDALGNITGLWWLWDADESPSFFGKIAHISLES